MCTSLSILYIIVETNQSTMLMQSFTMLCNSWFPWRLLVPVAQHEAGDIQGGPETTYLFLHMIR